jgi:hypothetical protein
MLAVRVERDCMREPALAQIAEPGHERRSLAEVLAVRQQLRAGGACFRRGPVAGAVVDDQHAVESAK